MKSILKSIGFLVITVFISSCVNLKHVNEFSTTSLEGIQAFEAINYNFQQACLDKCVATKLNTLKINDTVCNCNAEKEADSVSIKIYNALYGYFEGLSKLSNNELTSYKTEELETALTAGNFGSVTIKPEHAESYTKVANILLRVFTDTNRKLKIKNYVIDANQPVKKLISFLDFNLLANLNGKLEIKKERLKSDYFDLLKDDSLSTFERRTALKEYFAEINTIAKLQNKLHVYAESLKKIAKGHQVLYDDIHNLKVKEIKQALFQYASELKSIHSEFKKI